MSPLSSFFRALIGLILSLASTVIVLFLGSLHRAFLLAIIFAYVYSVSP